MKKILFYILALLFLPSVAIASTFTVPWTATSTSNGLAFPFWNGAYQSPIVPFIIGTSTATSTFAGSIKSPCFSTDGINCIIGGVSSISQTYGTTQTGAITLATSTQLFNGLTVAETITNSGGIFTITPLWSGTLNNAGLTNSTISGISLGSNLANLTATNNTLTFSGSYNGNTARTVGLNLGNANTWSALQTFGSTQNCVIGDNGSSGSLTCTDGAGNSVLITAASKALQVTGQSTFTALTVTNATSTNATSTNAVVSGNDRLSYITGSAQCLHVDTNGFVTGTGSDCSSSQWTTSGSDIYYNTGKVGIGTNLPGNALDVEGTFTSNSAIKIGSLRIQPYGLNNGFIEENTLFNGSDFVYNQTGQAGLFYFAGNEGQFRFANSGSAGASTGLATIAQLKINADGTFAVGASVSNAAGNYTGAKFIVNASGNVGIGTTTPSQILDVNGNINLEGSTHGIIMHDTATASCYLLQVTSGALALTAHACQ